MAAVLCSILAVVCVLLLLRVYTAERGLRNCVRQIREAEARGASARLRLETPNGATEALLVEINHLLEVRQTEQVAYRAREGDLRRQIANVSHDLRTPLTSILGYLQLLEGDGLTQAERAEYLGVVESRARALQSLIGSFYELTRLDGGELALKHEPVALDCVLSGLLASFYNDFTDQGFQVEAALEEGLPPVMGDEGAVVRVFTNLLRNALEHGDKTLSVALRREGEWVAAIFRNRTEGLSSEDVPHVFERFYTADKMRTGRGTGLGLAIVKGLVERMGGTVEATLECDWFTVRVAWRSSQR